MAPERKSRIKFVFENPPRGKFRRRVTVEEVKNELDSHEASKFLKITRRHLYRLMKVGKIPFKRKGGRYLFKVVDLDKWLVATGRRNPFESGGSGFWITG
jgi:excisionase family DNA binding protein